ncbi:hypothetical protein VF14_00810 [Nostoc linckia z18]|uniref:PRTRC system protein A n=2 Tax=Nostoc linckia TaxID=92942 RepID=A0A9Q5ZBL7_NOSLI|nr:hypothetical protein VF05_29620 [Nostoc linckia z3]PHJ67361.1 hypothetical protein VF02_05605 [Nostoc linckia z1]PHJ76817.1 hypothetical protein VF03_06345 [Nostoc linckia z2]PHJ78113.1 hypothetical protein VF06_29000 [Nostoc linckia z4]PHJ91797.1 hypothetical protein VF07_03850 [Nostoc linckia z6]PHJ96191.1 hypothetical protein VF04_16735 [Nostoc linckia z7]PHK03155.1 hypothetical protein VF08_16205 [Nostoc linckia z8]PHK13291.1 hypothetical protein VF09_00495 [Nostoc linckia z9]PHK2347
MNPLLEGIIGYKIVTTSSLPTHTNSGLEYLYAGNGIFARAIRPGIEVLMPIFLCSQTIKGLPYLTPYLKVTPLIPKPLLLEMWRLSYQAGNQFHEILFHLHCTDAGWDLQVPEQIQTPTSCQPTHSGSDSSHQKAAVDIHSHGSLPAFFSTTDNADESGFRIYGVLGRVNTLKPEIKLRVGLFRHCWDVPAREVFDIDPDFFMVDVSLSSGCKFYSTDVSPVNVMENLWR